LRGRPSFPASSQALSTAAAPAANMSGEPQPMIHPFGLGTLGLFGQHWSGSTGNRVGQADSSSHVFHPGTTLRERLLGDVVARTGRQGC
jgi:hypothetical protein